MWANARKLLQHLHGANPSGVGPEALNDLAVGLQQMVLAIAVLFPFNLPQLPGGLHCVSAPNQASGSSEARECGLLAKMTPTLI